MRIFLILCDSARFGVLKRFSTELCEIITTSTDFLKNAEVWYRALVVVTLDNDESQSVEQFRVFMEEGRETTLLQTNCVKSRI